MRADGAAARSVAIIGGGPKGLYCLERLLTEAGEHARRLRVDVYEPTGEFGAGAVYASAQPPHLRMNFADCLVDAWPQRASAVPAARRLTFQQWCERGGLTDPSGYSSRSAVGAYLRECFDAVVAAAPKEVDVTLRGRAVTAIELREDEWLLRSGEEARTYEQVMLTTGHRPPLPPEPGAPPPATYPLARALQGPRFRRGEVLICGMGLTFIDVVLELTEGRGGHFAGEQTAAGVLLYEPSGAEPAAITAISRTGRPMLAKPAPGGVLEVGAVEEAAADGRERLGSLADVAFTAGLTATIAAVAAELLKRAGSERNADPEALGAHLHGVLTGAAWRRTSTRDLVAGALAVACGERPADGWWALGESWRCLYPALVTRAGHGGILESEWTQFASLAREMERISFGPPPINAAKLLALIDAGIVRLERGAGAAPEADLAAVLPDPGAIGTRGDLVDMLLGSGRIRLAPGGRRGIEVEPAAGCIGADGRRTPGLAAVGRVTEDWVIGNDTLSRTLNSHPALWARELVAS